MKKKSFIKVAGIALALALLAGAVYIPASLMMSDAATVEKSDTNKDGIINTKDLIRIKKHIANPSAFPYSKDVDVNGDGSITKADITAAKANLGETYEIKVEPDYIPPTYDELVEIIMREARWVTDFCNYNNFVYGDSMINPAYNFYTGSVAGAINPAETVSSCNRFVSWVLYRAGFTDQVYFHGGLPSETLQSKYGFTKITNISQVRKGDIVYIPGHEFICAGTNQRYDHGSTDRIQRIGGYAYVENTNLPFNEAINSSFMYAMRPNPAGLPANSLSKIYNSVSDTYAAPSANPSTIANFSNVSWPNNGEYQLVMPNSYNPYNQYQYEIHLSVASVANRSYLNMYDSSEHNGAHVGVRLPASNHNPTKAGGIWLCFSDSAFATLFTGVGCGPNLHGTLWSEVMARVQLPVTFAQARRISVVDAGDVIKYYMYPGDGTRYLVCSIRVDTTYNQICVRDAAGKMFFCGITNLENSGYFSVWSHHASTTVLDVYMQKGLKAPA